MRIDTSKNLAVDPNGPGDGHDGSETRFEDVVRSTMGDKFHVLATSGANNPKVDAGTRAKVVATGDKAAIQALDDPNLADSSNTGPALSDIASVEKVSENVLKLTMKDGKVVVIVKQVTSYLFDAMAAKSDAANGIHKSESEGYHLAAEGANAPGLNDYANFGSGDEAGPGLIRYDTKSGDKVIVSKETNPELYEQVRADRETWLLINKSLGEGYRLAGPNEPSGIQLVGTPEELGHGLIRYQTDKGEKIIVSKQIAPDLYDTVAKFSAGVNGKPGSTDFSWIDNSKYSEAGKWDAITGNKTGKPTQEEKDLDRPAAVARMIADNWDNWHLGDGVDFGNPPADLPPEAQAALKYVANSPSLSNALAGDDHIITRGDATRFTHDAEVDLGEASKSYETFLKNNPNASDLAKQNAKSAAVVLANASLIGRADANGAGDSKHPDAGDIDLGKLNAVKDDPGLSAALRSAAGYWSTPGMFRNFDIGGDSPLTSKPDGIAEKHNFALWLEKQAPADDQGVLLQISGAVTRNSVSDVDTSKLTKDVLEHPENYDAKTKAAVFMQLLDARTQLALSAGKDGSDLYAGGPSQERGLNPNKKKVTDQLDAAIAKLGSDPEVQKYLADSQAAGMQAIVNSNPELKVALQHYQDSKINSGDIFNDALALKDANGKPLSLPDALRVVANDAALTNQALGGDGKVDLAAIAEKAGKTGDIEAYFRDHILNGKDLDAALADDAAKNGDKADPMSVIKKFAGDAAIFEAFLGDKLSAQDKANLEAKVNDTIADTILGTGSAQSLNFMLADANGNFDEAKVKALIDKAREADPSLFTDATGAPITTADLVSMLRATWDAVRQGEKIKDALPKAIEGLNLGANDAYKKGLLHLGSSFLAGGILAARATSGGNTPADYAAMAVAGMQFFGTFVEGGQKYAKDAGYGHRPVTTTSGVGTNNPSVELHWEGKGPFSQAELEKMANAGKVVGGLGTLVGGVLDLFSGVNSLLSGDRVAGGLFLTSGGLGVVGGFASLVEGLAGLTGGTTAVAGTIAGIAGWGGAIVGALAGVILPVIAVDKRAKQQDSFYDSFVPTLTQYGLTGGPVEDGDMPESLPMPGGTG